MMRDEQLIILFFPVHINRKKRYFRKTTGRNYFFIHRIYIYALLNDVSAVERTCRSFQDRAFLRNRYFHTIFTFWWIPGKSGPAKVKQFLGNWNLTSLILFSFFWESTSNAMPWRHRQQWYIFSSPLTPQHPQPHIFFLSHGPLGNILILYNFRRWRNKVKRSQARVCWAKKTK